jgi:hypothetical protein
VKKFLRRLFRVVNDPRYGLCYSPSDEEYKKAWESVVGDSLTRPFSLRTDPEPRTAVLRRSLPRAAPASGMARLSRQRVVCTLLRVGSHPRHYVAGGHLDFPADLARYSDGRGAAVC